MRGRWASLPLLALFGPDRPGRRRLFLRVMRTSPLRAPKSESDPKRSLIMPTNGGVPSFGGVGCAGRNSALISPAKCHFGLHRASCRTVSRAICALISIPGLVLDRRRQPDPLVDPLEVLFLGDFLLRRNLCVLRLGGTGKVVPIDPRCGDQTGYRAPTSRAALEGRVIHPVQHLVDDQAGRAFVLVNRHS